MEWIVYYDIFLNQPVFQNLNKQKYYKKPIKPDTPNYDTIHTITYKLEHLTKMVITLTIKT